MSIEVLILCGGRGTRISKIWQSPKILTPIKETTYLDIMISFLNSLEINCKN